MKRDDQAGFSLIELLLVCAIVGIIASLAVPALQKGVRAAESGATFGTMRTIAQTQVNCYTKYNRFCRLTELQEMLGNSLGTTAGDKVIRGRFTFEMNPVAPTDPELRYEYTITATRAMTDDIVYKYELTQTGVIVQLEP